MPSQEGSPAEIQGALGSSSLEPPDSGLRLPERGSAYLRKAPVCIHPGAVAFFYPTPGRCMGIRAPGELPQTWSAATSFLTPGRLPLVCSFYPLPSTRKAEEEARGAELYLPGKRSARSTRRHTAKVQVLRVGFADKVGGEGQESPRSAPGAPFPGGSDELKGGKGRGDAQKPPGLRMSFPT